MSSRDRLQKSIVLTSPSGKEFTAFWRGDTVSNAKKLGVFSTPGVKGVITQDLEVEANAYPLTFWFEGADNDLTASECYEACSEKGKWTVIHPVDGTKILQLVDYSKQVQPVTSGNVTEFNTNWLETVIGDSAKSSAQLSSLTKAQDIILADTTKTQLNEVVSQDTADKASKFKTAVENVVTAFDTSLQNITDQVASVKAQADSIKRGISISLAEPAVDVLSVAGQIRALVELPTLIVTDLSSKINTYGNFADSILGFSPETNSPAHINTAAVQEMALTSALGSVGVSSVTTALTSRQQVIDTIESNFDLFETITNGLDAVQDLYKDDLLKRAYFSQSQSFADSALLSAATLAFLIRSAFDLAVEKKITLTEQVNPVLFAAEQYGGFGDDDVNIDLFFDSNELTGDECYLLPVGKEVVVYV